MSEAFMIGLFSLIDVAMNRPLSDILLELPFSSEIKDALLGKYDTPLGAVYQMVLIYERGAWDKTSDYLEQWNLRMTNIVSMYTQAIKWANEIVQI